MSKKKEKTFDTVKFFRKVKGILADKMRGMTLTEKQDFLRSVKEGKIKISIN